MKYILLSIFLLSTGFLFYEGLKTDPSLVPSNLISKKVPVFELQKLNNYKLLTPRDLQNKEQLKIVNFFASWCPPCKVEHPQLMELANNYKIYGIAKKDNGENVIKWLKVNGNPFTKIGLDKDGISSIEWGVYGLPETFLIDTEGNIIYRHVEMKFLIFFLFIIFSSEIISVEPDEILNDTQLENTAREIGKKLRCMVCQNEDIESSNADMAKDLRILVRRMLVDGKTKDEILSYVHSRYGDFILFSPPLRYDTLALWIVPIVIFFLLIYFFFRTKGK
jgi:DsbE subfamily thiol:disulfide oxidoreductase